MLLLFMLTINIHIIMISAYLRLKPLRRIFTISRFIFIV